MGFADAHDAGADSAVSGLRSVRLSIGCDADLLARQTGLCSRRQECLSPNESGALAALRWIQRDAAA
jgi:hypothetical protein